MKSNQTTYIAHLVLNTFLLSWTVKTEFQYVDLPHYHFITRAYHRMFFSVLWKVTTKNAHQKKEVDFTYSSNAWNTDGLLDWWVHSGLIIFIHRGHARPTFRNSISSHASILPHYMFLLPCSSSVCDFFVDVVQKKRYYSYELVMIQIVQRQNILINIAQCHDTAASLTCTDHGDRSCLLLI